MNARDPPKLCGAPSFYAAEISWSSRRNSRSLKCHTMNHPTTRVSRWTCTLVACLLLFGHTSQSWAQARTGAISGRVTDVTGAVLKGAQVALEAQAISVVSNDQGLFFINGLAAGPYTLTVTYVGYFYSHFQVDAQGSVRIAQGLNVVLAGLNLNNEVFGFYQGDPQYMIQREYYQPTFEIGLRWSPGRR
jgi:hypothetical protein